MGLFGRRRELSTGNPNSVTAAGFRVHQKETEILRRLVQPWQARAFTYYDLLGEIKYAAQFYSRALSKLELFAAEIVPGKAGTIPEKQPTSNADAIEALDRIQDPGGGRSALLSSYGRLMFLAGEAYLLVTKDPETGMEQWEFLSTDELRVLGGTIMRFKAPTMLAEDLRMVDDTEDEAAWEPLNDKDAIPYRIWQRHPRFSYLADSTMQGVLDLCEELVLLTQAVRARARSRSAGSGLLLVDERISPKPTEASSPDEDPAEDMFLRDMTTAMMTPIAQEGSPSAVVPLITRISPPEGMKVSDMMYHLQLVDPTQLYPETGLRRECIERIAIGLDMPPEILLGLADSNHWSAWQIDEQTWKGHLQPKAQQLVDDLTAAYLRPMLREAGLADWARYCIDYDASAIINHPDRSKDAKDLYDRVALSPQALREANGFDESDAPTDPERAERIGILTRDSSLAWYGIPTVKAGGVEAEPGVVTSGQGTSGTPTGSTGAEVEKGPPATPSQTDETSDTAVTGSINAARILGAADLALLRAREVAGNRLRSLARKNPDVLAKLNGAPPGKVAAELGRDAVKLLKVSELDLVAGARPLILDAFRVYGLTDEQAAKVASQIEQHAARTLYDEHAPPLPPQFAGYLTGLLG